MPYSLKSIGLYVWSWTAVVINTPAASIHTLPSIWLCDILLTSQCQKRHNYFHNVNSKNQWFCGRSQWWHTQNPSHWTCDTRQEAWNTDGLDNWGAHRRSSSPPWHCKSERCGTGNFHEWTRSHHWIPSSDLGNLAYRRSGCGRIHHFSAKHFKRFF